MKPTICWKEFTKKANFLSRYCDRSNNIQLIFFDHLICKNITNISFFNTKHKPYEPAFIKKKYKKYTFFKSKIKHYQTLSEWQLHISDI